MTDVSSFLMGTGIPAFKFSHIGDTVTGYVFAEPTLQQITNFTTQAPEFWKDGSPKMQMRIVLKTDLEESDDDDGIRVIYVKGYMTRAVAAAVREAGGKTIEVGGKLRVKYAGDEPAKTRGLNPAKVYEAQYRLPTPDSSMDDEREQLESLVPQTSRRPPVVDVDPDEIPF